MSKSHVGLEQHICVVCGHPFDTGAILLDKRLRNSLEHHTITGYGMCPEHEKLRSEGYVALVACDPQKSAVRPNQTITPDNVYRTGPIAHLRQEVFKQIFDVPVPDKMVAYVEPEVITKLQAIPQGGASDAGS